MQACPQAPFTCYQTHLSYWLYKAAGSIAQGVKNAGTRLVVDVHTVRCNQREYSGPAVVSVVSRSLDPYLRLHYTSQLPSAFEWLKNHKENFPRLYQNFSLLQMEDQNYLEGRIFFVGLVGVILEGLQWHRLCDSHQFVFPRMTSLVGGSQLPLLLGNPNHYPPNVWVPPFAQLKVSPLFSDLCSLLLVHLLLHHLQGGDSLFQRDCLIPGRLLEASAPKAGGPLLEKVTIFHVRWNQRSGRSISGAPPLKITIAHALCYEPPNKSPLNSTKYLSFKSRKSWIVCSGWVEICSWVEHKQYLTIYPAVKSLKQSWLQSSPSTWLSWISWDICIVAIFTCLSTHASCPVPCVNVMSSPICVQLGYL